jgi:hypothetical protein
LQAILCIRAAPAVFQYLTVAVSIIGVTDFHFLTAFNACSADMTNLKQQLSWLKEADKFALQNSLKDLDTRHVINSPSP